MRKTLSWKHISKDRKQWMHNGMVKTAGGMLLEPYIAYDKRNTEFMNEDNDDE